MINRIDKTMPVVVVVCYIWSETDVKHTRETALRCFSVLFSSTTEINRINLFSDRLFWFLTRFSQIGTIIFFFSVVLMISDGENCHGFICVKSILQCFIRGVNFQSVLWWRSVYLWVLLRNWLKTIKWINFNDLSQSWTI